MSLPDDCCAARHLQGLADSSIHIPHYFVKAINGQSTLLTGKEVDYKLQRYISYITYLAR